MEKIPTNPGVQLRTFDGILMQQLNRYTQLKVSYDDGRLSTLFQQLLVVHPSEAARQGRSQDG